MPDAEDKGRPKKGEPCRTPRAQADQAARQARLAAEMRKNLLKRKRQQRARRAPDKPADR